MKKQVGVALCLAWAVVFFLAGPAQAIKFRYENLGTLGGGQSYPAFAYKEAGLNDAGQVVGFSHTAGGALHAFVKSPGQAMLDLGNIPGSTESHAPGINQSGVIGGTYLENGAHACKWVPSGGGQYQLQDLGEGGSGSAIHGLNNAGYFAGNGLVSGFYQAHVLPPGGSPYNLGHLPGDLSSFALSINEANIIVGHSLADTGGTPTPTACVWTPSGSSWNLAASLFGVSNSKAFAINNPGQTVGYVEVAANTPHAVLKNPETAFQDLGSLAGDAGHSTAYNINDNGWVVGSSDSSGGTHAFLWTPTSGMQDLNNLVVNLPAGVTLAWAHAINRRGEIAGYTTDGVFKLTPIANLSLSLLLLD